MAFREPKTNCSFFLLALLFVCSLVLPLLTAALFSVSSLDGTLCSEKILINEIAQFRVINDTWNIQIHISHVQMGFEHTAQGWMRGFQQQQQKQPLPNVNVNAIPKIGKNHLNIHIGLLLGCRCSCCSGCCCYNFLDVNGPAAMQYVEVKAVRTK